MDPDLGDVATQEREDVPQVRLGAVHVSRAHTLGDPERGLDPGRNLGVVPPPVKLVQVHANLSHVRGEDPSLDLR